MGQDEPSGKPPRPNRRTVEGYRPEGLAPWIEGKAVFNDEVIDEILEGVPFPVLPWVTVANFDIWEERIHADRDYPATKSLPGRELLRYRLNIASQMYALSKEATNRPTHHLLAQEFERIEIASERLLQALRVPSANANLLPPALREDPGLDWAIRQELRGRTPISPVAGQAALRSAVSGVGRLRDWAKAAREEHEQTDAALAEIPPGELPREASPEQDLVEGLIATWRDAFGQADVSDKQFRTFVAVVAEKLGLEMTDTAIRRRVEKSTVDPG